jgi:hypothetical protein
MFIFITRHLGSDPCALNTQTLQIEGLDPAGNVIAPFFVLTDEVRTSDES